MAYMKSYKDQDYLLPPRITDLFPENHVCYLINQVTDSLDYSEFDEKYDGAGHPAIHPRIKLNLLLMGHVDGITSSRKIAKNGSENIVYIYLAEKTSPNFRTISNFRRNHPKVVEEAILQLAKFAYEEGLIDLSHLMVDSTTIKANANDDRILEKESIEKLRKYIEKEIKKGIKVDEEEDKLYGDRGLHQLPENLNDSEKRRPIVRKIVDEINKAIKENKTERVEEIKEELEKLDEHMKKEKLKKYSFTDPEARFMLSKKGKIELNYNCQLVTDKNGIIISNDVVQDCDDRHQLLPNIKRVEQDFGQLPEGTIICTDGLYLSPDIVELDERGYNLFMPTYGMQKNVKNEFDKVNFKYDEENDRYICPEGKILEFLGKSKNKKYEYIMTYRCKDCPTCPHQKACCKKQNYKRITAPPHDKLINQIKEKMQTEEGKEIYKLRMQTVETGFGDIKHNKKFRSFLLRGLEKVKIEWNLVCMASNLVKINNLLKGRSISSC